MGALDRRGVKTKGKTNRKFPHILKDRKKRGLDDQPVLSPEQLEIENWVNDSENPQIVAFRGNFRTKSRKEAMIAAMMQTMGIITQAVEMAGIGLRTHYDWLDSDPDYGNALTEALRRKKDFGEHALMKLVKDGDSAAVRFFNETINKDRGYIKRQEVVNSFSGTQNIKIVIPDNDQSDEPTETQSTKK